MSAPLSPSGDAAAGRGAPLRLLALTAVLLVVRLCLAGRIHLTEDEAYYRLWSLAPALGYYDHPPMIAWWIWLGRQLAGDTALGVRLLPILGSALSSLLVFRLALEAGASRPVAERAGLWFNAMLLPLAGGFLAVPDAPASLFWILALVAAIRAQRRGSWPWWAVAGVAAGLATLSKYSAIFLAPGVLLWLGLTPEGRRSLRQPGPWLAAGLAFALFGLNIVWNAQHGWLTFHKQFGRVAVHGLAPRYAVEFVVTQAGLLNPVLVVLAAAGAAARPPDHAARRILSPVVAASAPFVAYLLIHSLHDRVQAHWPAPVYPALAVAAAVLAGPLWDERPRWARWGPSLPALGAGFVVVAICALALQLPLAPRAPDVLSPVRGWTGFAGDLDRARRKAGAAWIGTLSYGLDAQLADEPSLAAPVLQLHERSRYQGLNLAAPDPRRPGLITDLPRRLTRVELDRCFTHVTALPNITRGAVDGRGVVYAVFAVSGPRRDIVRDGC